MGSKRLQAAVVAAVTILALAGVYAAGHAATSIRTVTVTSANTTGNPANWQGDIATGSNTDYTASSGDPCNDADLDGDGTPETTPDPQTYCDKTLLNFSSLATFWTGGQSGGADVNLNNFSPSPASDFDLYIYKSDASGTRGALVDQSGAPPGSEETATIPTPTGYYLVQVVYFAVASSRYDGHVTLSFFKRNPVPPDVDSPKGLQDILASNASAGWKSRSEPHIAQSPLNPDLLIAGSKFYNKDRDSLLEYEFKIGTFVSFNGGRTWTDLGQIDAGTCPASQSDNSGADAWPNNVCYPPDNPSKGGTGPEDQTDNRGHTDINEEYITSDVWIQFDDEGNAYAMVLDSPPYGGSSGASEGWGMTLHKWTSVSQSDLATGNTWSHRHPINAYPDDPRRTELHFLDDKNTFAVNNAGPNNEGTSSNIIIACWGQNAATLIKQQEVCERSPATLGGQPGIDWSGEPVPVSGAHQLVIGINVQADKANPLQFYAVYLQYESSIATSNATVEFVRTVDGGLTWTAPVVIGVIDDLPTQYPHQSFRNLSIPMLGVGPDPDGTGPNPAPLYVVLSEYMNAPTPATDEDGKQADIDFFKSTNGGAAWTKKNLTAGVGPNLNSDQFQPQIDVTPSGQIDVIYFDRRNDVKTSTHDGNYYVDTYLTRSNDGGTTFTDVRLSHDVTDPEFNAPVSGSGAFFGDYQGLVADDCSAIPFVNDTHLANDKFLDPGPTRDPEFDNGLRSFPDVKYQQAIDWRVPNTADFGGNGKPDLSPTNIRTSSAPTRGTRTTLKATINNLECVDALNVVVRFLDNGQEIGGGDKFIANVPGDGAKTASVGWTPKSTGNHTITVIVDPNSAIPETKEDNNSATRVFRVRAPTSGGDSD